MVSKVLIYIGAVLILAVLSLAVLANSMTKPVGHDEQMYCTAGALLAQGKMIYRDFSYVAQMPYHPLLYAALFKALNTSYYLLTGRIVSVVCDILVVVCIVGIYRLIFKPFVVTGLLLGLGASVLWIFNPLVDYANGFAWNHDVVILCVTLSLWLLLSTDLRLKSRYWTGQISTIALETRNGRAVPIFSFSDLLHTPSKKTTKTNCTITVVIRIQLAKVRSTPIRATFQYLDFSRKSVDNNNHKDKVTQRITTS